MRGGRRHPAATEIIDETSKIVEWTRMLERMSPSGAAGRTTHRVVRTTPPTE